MTLEASYALAIFTVLVFIGGCLFGRWFQPTDEVICGECGVTIEPEEEGEDE